MTATLASLVPPGDLVGDTKTRIVAALLAGEARTVRGLMAATGVKSTAGMHAHLRDLDDLGLVAYPAGKQGAIAARVEVV